MASCIHMRLQKRKHAPLLLLVAVAFAWSQAGSDQPTIDTGENSTSNSTRNADADPNSDQMPIWQPDNSLGAPPESPSSFFMADIFGTQGAETNTGLTNSSSWGAYSRAFGGLHFLKVERRFETAIDYRAGSFFQDTNLSAHRQTQELNATELIPWKTGELSLADSMSNYAGGSFGSPWFGGASLYNLNAGGTGAGIPAIPGTSDLFGITSFAGVGQGEHFTNLSVAEVSQFLSKRSIFSAAAGYGISNFFDRQQNFINSSQISGLADYSYDLSPKSEIGLAYSYRTFIFPKNNGSVVTNLVELTYLQQLSRRLSIQMGVGPEFERMRQLSTIDFPLVGPVKVLTHTRATNAAAFGSLSYRTRKANVAISYSREVTSGSGFYAGAQSDFTELSVSRRLFRSWNATSNAGYAHLSQLAQSALLTPAQSYQFWFAGLAVGRRLSQHWSLFASYQYNNENFASTICVASGVCNRVITNAALVGFRWRTRPYRLDSGNGEDMQIHSTRERPSRPIDPLLPKTEDEGSMSTPKSAEEF